MAKFKRSNSQNRLFLGWKQQRKCDDEKWCYSGAFDDEEVDEEGGGCDEGEKRLAQIEEDFVASPLEEGFGVDRSADEEPPLKAHSGDEDTLGVDRVQVQTLPHQHSVGEQIPLVFSQRVSQLWRADGRLVLIYPTNQTISHTSWIYWKLVKFEKLYDSVMNPPNFRKFPSNLLFSWNVCTRVLVFKNFAHSVGKVGLLNFFFELEFLFTLPGAKIF